MRLFVTMMAWSCALGSNVTVGEEISEVVADVDEAAHEVSLGSARLVSANRSLSEPIELRVLALNTWGMPAWLGSLLGSHAVHKEARMQAIGEYIRRAEHDVYLLSEVWMRADHATVRALVPQGYYMTEYSEFNHVSCDGWYTLYGCSGLAIVSRFPPLETQFTSFTYRGDGTNLDGEYWAGKGTGRVRVAPRPGTLVDLFVTHTVAHDTNVHYRERQVDQLVRLVNGSDADFVILGGDLNFQFRTFTETSYEHLDSVMVNSHQEYANGPRDMGDWLGPEWATYGHPNNTFTNMHSPMVIDYVWHRANGHNAITTEHFEVPVLKAGLFFQDPWSPDILQSQLESISDHEAVSATLNLQQNN